MNIFILKNALERMSKVLALFTSSYIELCDKIGLDNLTEEQKELYKQALEFPKK